MAGVQISRRAFVTAAGGAAGAVLLAGPASAQEATDAEPDALPYGPLGDPDENGLRLPEGFTSRVLARAGEVVEGTDYEWHVYPDGGAAFPMDDGGWVLTSNSELLSTPEGGAGALRFDSDGEVVDAYRILSDTLGNCAGGVTPWGTWLSCEEHPAGQVWECDPTGEAAAVVHPALGSFAHEAVAVDPERERLYLTEDQVDGRFYRFTPDAYPSLAAGVLEAAKVDGESVTWLPIDDPSGATTPTKEQAPDSTVFVGGEGLWYHEGIVFFTTKGDGRVWRLDPEADRLTVLYRPPADVPVGQEPLLNGVDNIVVAASGEVLVCEDHGGEQDVVLVGLDGSVGRVARLTGQPQTELTGVAIAPTGDRIYFSSQRGGEAGTGITYEVRGPFRQMVAATPTTVAPTTAPASAGSPTTAAEAIGSDRSEGAVGEDGDDGVAPIAIVGGVGALLVVAAAGAWRLRTRRDGTADPEPESQV